TDVTIKDHVITVAQSAQHQSLSVFLDDPLSAVDYKHALGCVESLELSYEQGKFLEYALKAKAKKGEVATLTPVTTTENYFLPQHFSLKIASALAGLDAATAVVVKSMKLKIGKKLEEDYNLGSVAPTDFLVSGLTIEGDLEAVWQDEATFKTAALAGTAKAVRIDLKNTDVTIGSAANPEIKIDLAKVIFKELTRPFKVGEIVKQSLSFKAHYSITDSKSITITCTNNTASY
ncbi:MAG: phage tail tube protein, partial [Candidatus Cloacimonetes bacterium]|nr:phage tail tube protein [Candidatus Cloacimonadota bacterium]